MNSVVYRKKVVTWDELLDHIMEVIASIIERQGAPRSSTHMSTHESQAAAVLVLQDGSRRNSHRLQLYFLVTEMKMYPVAIAQMV
jgi:hypothetical protein